MKTLEQYGFELIEPATGFLACRDVGEGKLPDPEVLLQYILRELAFEKDMTGKKVLVTAGEHKNPSTRSAILPITLPGKWDMPLQDIV